MRRRLCVVLLAFLFLLATGSVRAQSGTNQAPTITTVMDQTIPMNSSGSSGSFVIGDDLTEPDMLTLSASSSNSTLLPSANITFERWGAHCLVKVIPAANRIGTTTVTLSVSDGAQASTSQYVLTVLANQPPTISTIADQTIDPNGVTAVLPFTIGDDLTPPGNLTVEAFSGNNLVVQREDITLGGSGANRTVKVKAMPNHPGRAAIGLFVRDGIFSSYREFTVTVTGQNDPPVISPIADQTIPVNGTTGPLAFTVTDDLTPVGVMVRRYSTSDGTLVPIENVELAGSDGNFTLKVTPAAGKTGTATIQIGFDDGTQESRESFVVKVVPNQPPTITDIPDQTLDPNGVTAAIPFTIGDDFTPVGDLKVNVSFTGNVIDTVVLSGSGANRTVTVKAKKTPGQAAIILNVNDGTSTTYKSFNLTVTNRNDPPTISQIADQTIPVNGSTGPLAFTVGDDLTEPDMLDLSHSCNNTALVPLENIVFGGSGANRTVKVTPAAGQSGTATVQVNFDDGTQAGSMRFAVTVVPNQPPTITVIPDQTIDPYGSTAVLPFTVGDDFTPVENLWVYGAYNGTGMVDKFVLGGSGANRTLTIKAGSEPGTTPVTLIVQDGTLSTNMTFTLRVRGRNDPPTVSQIADQNIAMNGSTGPLAFTIGDDRTPPDSLYRGSSSSNRELVPLENIVFGGSGANPTITVTPAAGKTGKATIQVGIGDGTQASHMFFTVTVFAPPTLTSFSPTSGPVGTSVVITGTNFTGATGVSFNGKGATFTVNSATQITAKVPGPATTGLVSVTTPGGTATSATAFTVTPGGDSTAPVITITTPAEGLVLN